MRSGHNVMAPMNILCMHTEEGAVPCTLTAATSLHVFVYTQCNICTTRLQLYVYIYVLGCSVRLTCDNETNKHAHHIHLWQLSSFPPQQTRGSMEQGLLRQYTQRMQNRSKHRVGHTVALAVCVDGHHQ